MGFDWAVQAQPQPRRCYISSELASAKDFAAACRWYEQVASVCAQLDWEPFLPHLHSDDPQGLRTAAEVYRHDSQAVLSSGLLVSDLTGAGAGVGAALAVAFEAEIPVIALQRPRQAQSRFILGMLETHPRAWVVSADSSGELLVGLRQALAKAGPPQNSDGRWELVERPGYFGANRTKRHREYDERFGAGNWRLAWQVESEIFDRVEMTMLYEDAYFSYLSSHPRILDRLIREASDVFDDAPSNIGSELDYSRQETDRTHVQDIAIRRCVRRLGRHFAGLEPIQIRDVLGPHPLSKTLSPGRVPFHRLELLVNPQLKGWWRRNSVESFYQSNKILQRRVA
jgi:hypothetical protein